MKYCSLDVPKNWSIANQVSMARYSSVGGQIYLCSVSPSFKSVEMAVNENYSVSCVTLKCILENKFHSDITFIWIFRMYGFYSCHRLLNFWSLFLQEVKHWFKVHVNCWIKEIRNIGRRCQTTFFVIFNSDMAQHKQNIFIENVEAKLTNQGKKLNIPIENKDGDHEMLKHA